MGFVEGFVEADVEFEAVGAREVSGGNELLDSGGIVVARLEDCSFGWLVGVGLGEGVERRLPLLEVTVAERVSAPSCRRCNASPVGDDTPLQTRTAAHDRRRMLVHRMVLRLLLPMGGYSVILI